MNLGEMRTDVLTRMREDPSSPVYFQAADVDKAINEGLEDLSETTNWFEKSVDVRYLHNHMYYDMRTVVAENGGDFLMPTRCFNPQTNRWLIPSDVMDLDLHTYRMWEAIQSASGTEPQRMIWRGLSWLGLFPKPAYDYVIATNVGRVVLYYRAVPLALVADSDSPGFPTEFHQALVFFAMYDLYCQERELKKSQLWMQQYGEVAGAFRRYCDNRIVESAYPGFR